MGRNVKVNVEYLTRVEGHGNIVVNVKDNKREDNARADMADVLRDKGELDG